MRLKSNMWIGAYLRRCQVENAFALVRRRGAEDGGAIYVKVALMDGRARLYTPAPQSAYEASGVEAERLYSPAFGGEAMPEDRIEAKLKQEIAFDPDIWIVEIEDREGRHFLDLMKD